LKDPLKVKIETYRETIMIVYKTKLQVRKTSNRRVEVSIIHIFTTVTQINLRNKLNLSTTMKLIHLQLTTKRVFLTNLLEICSTMKTTA
jgi:hypothetical protein